MKLRNLVSNTKYQIQVAAINRAGIGNFSQIIYANTGGLFVFNNFSVNF